MGAVTVRAKGPSIDGPFLLSCNIPSGTALSAPPNTRSLPDRWPAKPIAMPNQKPRRIHFAKAESLRNDFIIVHQSATSVRWTRSLVQRLCDRRCGVGADGLIILSKRRAAQIGTRMFNADGSPFEWSGNGLRCASAVVAAQRGDPHRITFLTGAGLMSVSTKALRDRQYEVSIVRPAPAVTKGRPLSGMPRRTPGSYWTVAVGNPQWVFFVHGFDFDWQNVGLLCQRRAHATGGVNVGFTRIHSRRKLEMRVYERGVGPTPASGSGALAAVAAAAHLGKTDSRVTVVSPGGRQRFIVDTRSGGVTMLARARVLFEGDWGV